MNTTTAAANLANITQVLDGAKALLDIMRRTGCVNGTGYYPREVIAQERRVAALTAAFEAAQNVEAPRL